MYCAAAMSSKEHQDGRVDEVIRVALGDNNDG
jgi:hypothetical protein